jgi:hypothetical protein
MSIHEVRETSTGSASAADYLSTLSTPALQEHMRATPTRPLSELLNGQMVTIDYDARRVWRDSYWKGSFARDTIMGFEERLLTPIRRDTPPYAGGRFWKRFDALHDGEADGYIVNYGIGLLPGRALVRTVKYPDGGRRYIGQGDEVLLLSYLNQPYRIVYDLIKIVDANNCVGVMHLGTFPNGYEFATFVMARNNYPFEKMAVPDHDAIFNGNHVRVPSASELAGSWTGYVVFLRRPELALHNQFNPPLLRCRFDAAPEAIVAQVSHGPLSSKRWVQFEPDCVRLTGSPSSSDEIRQVDADTLLGRRIRNKQPGVPAFRYVLKRSNRPNAPPSM